jgi:arylamine N-acetyltransferase
MVMPSDWPAPPIEAVHKGMAYPPPPESTDAAGVKAWIERYIDDAGWELLVSNGSAAMLLAKAPLTLAPDRTVRFEVRIEAFVPRQYRSARTVMEVDCAGLRLRRVSDQEYSWNNSRGPNQTDSVPEATWKQTNPGSGFRSIVDVVCARARG